MVPLKSVAKGLMLADDDFGSALPGTTEPSEPPSAVQRMPSQPPARGDTFESSMPGAEDDESQAAASVPNGSVLYGKFRVIGARRRVGDELAFKALHLGTGRRVELRVLPEGISAHSPEAERM